ncbi:unnamed protein product [Pleuronectes platessa]|uniref:Uncharacterized protein n=1 Tax=Pleuronectes platessa TaxID=8262 RepID=A0A9N7VPJ6_PLEPL|nr:unnamed protein product [Pleuronectes platessa]
MSVQNSSSERGGRLPAEELRLGSFPFAKGEDECRRRGGTGVRRERPSGGGGAADLLNLARGGAPFLNRTPERFSLSPRRALETPPAPESPSRCSAAGEPSPVCAEN